MSFKAGFIWLVCFIGTVLIMAFILWLVSPDHEPPFLYYCHKGIEDQNICDGNHQDVLYLKK